MNGLTRYWATPSPTAPLTVSRSRAAVTAITSTRLLGGPQPPADLEAAEVGQVDVEQHEVGLVLEDAPQRLGAAVGDARDDEAVDALDVALVDVGDAGVVVDDERADGHRARPRRRAASRPRRRAAAAP